MDKRSIVGLFSLVLVVCSVTLNLDHLSNTDRIIFASVFNLLMAGVYWGFPPQRSFTLLWVVNLPLSLAIGLTSGPLCRNCSITVTLIIGGMYFGTMMTFLIVTILAPRNKEVPVGIFYFKNFDKIMFGFIMIPP